MTTFSPRDLAESGGQVFRPETTPLVPQVISVDGKVYFLWRKVPMVTLSFEVRDGGITVRVVTKAMTREELADLIPNCPMLRGEDQTIEFQVEFPVPLDWTKAKRIGTEDYKGPFDGIVIPSPSIKGSSFML